MSSSSNLEAIYDAHAPALFGFALNLTRNETDARDVLQEVFCKLATRPTLLHGLREPRAFLLHMTHNLAVDFIRRSGTRAKAYNRLAVETEGLFAPASNPEDQSFRQSLSEALEELPRDQRAVVHLKLWENQTFEAIAETLDIPPNTAASRYRYGLDKLRARLRPLYDELK